MAGMVCAIGPIPACRTNPAITIPAQKAGHVDPFVSLRYE
jgi:hypothetical protein